MTAVLHLVVRDDGTWDYRYCGEDWNDEHVKAVLRTIADQIEQNAYLPHGPKWETLSDA